jgi:intein/homing endonuclease
VNFLDPKFLGSWEYSEPRQDEERISEDALRDAQIPLTPSQFIETTMMMPNPHSRKLENFSFAERQYLRQIYDIQAPRVLLMCGRQVEKTVHEDELVLLSTGRHVRIKDVQLGDRLVCLNTDEVADGVELGTGHLATSSDVTWKSARYNKPCVRVCTRQGHKAVLATTHPIRVWGGWRTAGDVRVGDRIAVVRRAGEFHGLAQSDSRVKLTAFMLGDGHCSPSGLSFTNATDVVLADFIEGLTQEGMTYGVSDKVGTEAVALRLPRYRAQKLYDWIGEDGLLGKTSYTKSIPEWVFHLPRQQTAMFLNRLWATDGHVKQNTGSKWSIEYCSMSHEMIRQVQALLWKFGVPSSIRKNWPAIYKRRGEDVTAYILRVETQEGVRTFVREIGALGKIEQQNIPSWESSSNRDTYPEEVTQLVRDIYNSVRPTKGERTLRAAGIERLPRKKYTLTRRKLEEFVIFFEGDVRYDQERVALLRAHLHSDIYWDEVEEIVDEGDCWCFDLTVRGHHNFVAGAIFTHNSTTLGNKTLSYACLIPHFRILYVSPSSQQTKEFSKTRLREPLETCPDLRTWFPGHLTDNVFEKKAINRSEIKLRYAFLNADRCRGLSADLICMDEFQDLLLDNIPVIEEAASHSPFKWFIYSGTPKSLDNPIQRYWDAYSTQNEWAVPCERHGFNNNPGTWHWNILGERNIGITGLSCDKCGELIRPDHPMAQWVKTGNPNPKFDIFEGFRIPQLMVPWLEWSNILTKYNQYPRAKFYNEVLGASFDSGQRPLTEGDVQSCCDPDFSLKMEKLKEFLPKLRGKQVYAGIDWGQDSNNSYTIIFIGSYIDGAFRIVFAHRFSGAEAEPKEQIEKIKKLLTAFQITRVGVDYGGGYWPNDELLRTYGSQKIVRYQYSTPKTIMKFDAAKGRFLIHRSEVMSAVFNAIKRRVFKFPKWSEFGNPFGSDMLAIFSEYNERTRMTEYKKAHNTTDDSFHALLLCFIVSMIDHPRPDIIVPSAKIDRELDTD